MSANEPKDLETDPRFPSGPWTGYFLQSVLPGKHWMELQLTFCQGVLTGSGRDMVGAFIFRGRYDIQDGKCHWSKRYLGRHDVFYQGFNEGKGIWGVWEMPETTGDGAKGGFHIWPKGMPDPSQQHLSEAKEMPTSAAEEAPAPAGELVGAGESAG